MVQKQTFFLTLGSPHALGNFFLRYFCMHDIFFPRTCFSGSVKVNHLTLLGYGFKLRGNRDLIMDLIPSIDFRPWWGFRLEPHRFTNLQAFQLFVQLLQVCSQRDFIQALVVKTTSENNLKNGCIKGFQCLEKVELFPFLILERQTVKMAPER